MARLPHHRPVAQVFLAQTRFCRDQRATLPKRNATLD
jgi:hypothetical protein